MVRLHLVGFTTDLKNLIFATRRGAKRGGYVVAIDRKLGGTLLEVDRLEQQAKAKQRGPAPALPPEPVRASSLSPKQIQTLLREGKSEEQVAKLADTDVAWIRRFVSPILAERDGVIRSVRAATISKPRLGPSSLSVGEAIVKNLESKRIAMEPDDFEAGWKAVRKVGRWMVTFQYSSRGKRRLARFSFDPEARKVEPANPHAFELAWAGSNAVRRRRPAAAASRNGKRPSGAKAKSGAGSSLTTGRNGRTSPRASAKRKS